MRMDRVLWGFSCCVSAVLPLAARGQKQIPIRQLGAAEARSKDTVGFLYGVRETSDGHLLANDPTNRRLILFDASLGSFKVVADTTPGTTTPYGARPTTIMPFRGDSTLFVDVYSHGFVVIAPNGASSRVIAAPRANDVGWIANTLTFGQPGIDPKGRIVYRAYPAYRERDTTASLAENPDSAPIIRGDFETRTTDTIGLIAIPAPRMSIKKMSDGRQIGQLKVNPMSYVDDWALLPDGTVAILRGRDYHLDWINADGTRASTPKMPFDWRRLTDAEKQAVLDSTKAALEKQRADRIAAAASGRGAGGAPVQAMASAGAVAAGGGGGGMGGNDMGPRPGGPPIDMPAPDVVSLRDLPDYVPPVFKTGTMRADPSGNIWILPSTSSQAAGGLLYDVINRTGEIFERVRLPQGRALAGFGANGVVYLTAHDATGTHLERSRIGR